MKLGQYSSTMECEDQSGMRLTIVTGSDVLPWSVGLGHRRVGGHHFSIQLLLQSIQATQVQGGEGSKLLLFSWRWRLLLQHLQERQPRTCCIMCMVSEAALPAAGQLAPNHKPWPVFVLGTWMTAGLAAT